MADNEDVKIKSSDATSEKEKKNLNLVEMEGGVRSKNVTPSNTSEGPVDRRQSSSAAVPKYGKPDSTQMQGRFPALGSQIGSYFCLGQLGKGTFSSIHKCVNMEYRPGEPRLAAAKVELSDFSQSGVLDAEATILAFLDAKLPKGNVPVFMGHYRSGATSALMMEYLPGPDMHQLREKATQDVGSRRIDIDDAVYLTADVMLPLLKQMHQVGIVHRDVKPSNCVRTGASNDFKIVDFGLSKSIVVAEDSSFADTDKPWEGEHWLEPLNYNGRAFYRKPREKADFRGTSMYASLRVHELIDYAPRDDMWSLLYVFCDLISGGLPWMHHAANRDRDRCHKMKERIHGLEEGQSDATEELLMGDAYHKAVFNKERQKSPVELPEPLFLAKDQEKVDALRKAFNHLKDLGFTDRPDYNLIRDCIYAFRGTEWPEDSSIPKPKRLKYPKQGSMSPIKSSDDLLGKRSRVQWRFEDVDSNLNPDVFEVSEETVDQDTDNERSLLSPELRYKVAQVEYNAIHYEKVDAHVALNDWMQLATSLLYEEWDAKRFELGGHRTSTDGFRREHYLKLLKCVMKWAEPFDDFCTTQAFFENEEDGIGRRKLRRIEGEVGKEQLQVPLVLVGITATIDSERRKRPPPPARIGLK